MKQNKKQETLEEILGSSMFDLEQQLDIPSSLRWHNSKPKQETLTDANNVLADSDTVRSCQNCKFYTAYKNRCNHEYWGWCIKRDDNGYVTSYDYHHFR